MNKSKDFTGVSRKVKDNVINWHNYTVRWNDLNYSSLANVKELCNYVIENSSNNDEKLNEMLEPIEKTIFQMEELVKKMSRLTSEFKYLSEGNDVSFSDENEQIVSRWQINKFYEMAKELLDAYKKEVAVKGSCVREFARHQDRRGLMYIVCCWEYQVNLDSVKFHTEVMLHELDLRRKGKVGKNSE